MSDQSKDAGSIDLRVPAALREYLERIDHGEAVNREEFISRHADIADALRSFIAAEEELRKLARARISRASAGLSTRTFVAPGQETLSTKSQPGGSSGGTGSGLQGRFGRYQIVRALGQGAMGTVYLAQDTKLKRYVAIKTPHFEDDPTGELLKRFYREAEAAATLRHPNICPVYDLGQIDGKHFISMAYIDGRSLSELIYGGKAQNERHIVIAVHKLARALQEAHDHGVVHRDLKPANIMVDKKGEPIIMDFGLARKARKEGEASLTQRGAILGSPAYMSPEQIEGDPDIVGPASDQYSLGVVLYEMLTGQLPFRGSVVNVLAQILTKEMTRPSALRAGLDPRIEDVCLRMMAKNAADRFPSMRAVADGLAAIVKNPSARPSTAEQPPAANRVSSSLAPRGEAAESQVRKSLEQDVITESESASLEPAERWKSLIDTPSFEHSFTARAAIRRATGRRVRWMWSAVAVGTMLLALAAVWAAGLLKVVTKEGTIVLHDLPDNAEVLVDGAKVAVHFAEGGGAAEITVVPGEHQVQVRKGELIARGERVSVASGERKPLTVSLEPLPRRISPKERDESPTAPRTGGEAQTPTAPLTGSHSRPIRSAADNEGVDHLKTILRSYKWSYSDSLYPGPGSIVRFYSNGKFHDEWHWNYWVVGPQTMHIQFWDPKHNPKSAVVATFSDDLTTFHAAFSGHEITGTRLERFAPDPPSGQ